MDTHARISYFSIKCRAEGEYKRRGSEEEMEGEEMLGMGGEEQGLPPGFRFHPTDEELITYYLASKVYNLAAAVDIAEVDLNRCEPWELPERAKMGEREWYLFSLRDRKYPTGLRTNRATGAGYWKATGKDRQVLNSNSLIGMKKTLVFYKGRAPRGHKTNWVMHEYRLHGHLSSRHAEEWVMCRIYHKSGDKKTPNPHPPAALDVGIANNAQSLFTAFQHHPSFSPLFQCKTEPAFFHFQPHCSTLFIDDDASASASASLAFSPHCPSLDAYPML